MCAFLFFCFVQEKKVTALEDIDITVDDDKVCATKNDIIAGESLEAGATRDATVHAPHSPSSTAGPDGAVPRLLLPHPAERRPARGDGVAVDVQPPRQRHPRESPRQGAMPPYAMPQCAA